MEYKGIIFCSGEVGKELTEKEIQEIKKEIDKKVLTIHNKSDIINIENNKRS